MPPEIVHAEPKHIPRVRELFTEYAATLPYSLCFQGFEEELATLPGKYGPPAGRLLLALDGESLVGSVAVRHVGPGPEICEMKRLYIRPAGRGTGLGRRLAEAIISEARQIGYLRMRLDTDPGMVAARHIYHSLGFRSIDNYNRDPIPGTLFMELDLTQAPQSTPSR